MSKKKEKWGMAKDIMPPLILGGGAMGASILGGKLDSYIPAGTINPLTTTGSVMGKFIKPVAVISAGGIIFKQMRKLEKKVKGGKK